MCIDIYIYIYTYICMYVYMYRFICIYCDQKVYNFETLYICMTK